MRIYIAVHIDGDMVDDDGVVERLADTSAERLKRRMREHSAAMRERWNPWDLPQWAVSIEDVPEDERERYRAIYEGEQWYVHVYETRANLTARELLLRALERSGWAETVDSFPARTAAGRFRPRCLGRLT